MIQEVIISAKLKNCRDTAKRLFGDQFELKCMPYKKILSGVMEQYELGVLEAFIKISQTDAYHESGLVQMMFMASAVELIESEP